MATTNKGIYYPNNYSNVADVPEDMKKLAESVDTQISNLDTNKVDKVDGKGLSTNDYTNEDKAKLDSLENYDDTEITQEIEDIQAKDESQDTEIDKQSDLIQKLKDNCINVTTEEATSLHVTDASILPAKLDVRGNHSQETREGYNVLQNKLTSTTINGVTFTINEDKSVTLNGTATNSIITNLITGKYDDNNATNPLIIPENITNYRLSGCPSGGSGSTYKLDIYSKDNILIGTDFGEGIDISKNSGGISELARVRIIVYAGAVLNNVTFYPMIIYGAENKPYEQYGASPSLDYLSEVRAVGDNGSVEIKKLTENVINLSKSVALHNTEITEIDEENGIIKVHRTNTQDPSIQIFCNLPAGQYTMLHNSHNFGQVSVYGKNKIVDIGSEKYKIFNATENITDIRIYSGSELPTDYEINFSDIVLVMGNVAREDIEYVKYKEQSLVLDIQKPMLQGDCFIKEANGWKEVHGWNKNTYDETDNFSVFVTDDVFQFYLPTTISQSANLLCNMFTQKNDWTSTSVVVSSNNKLYFLVKKGEYGFTSDLTAEQALTKFKEIIATNNIVLYNATNTPTKLPCTEAQSNVLDQLNEIELFKSTNNIITAEGLALMQMQYIADTETYIDNRIDEKLLI